MSSNPYGLQLSETMMGYMGPADDYHEGYRAGKSAGNTVRFTATIVIDDLEPFLDDPEHPAALTTSLDYTVLGSGLRVENGRFHLFSRHNDQKRMLYYLPFDQGEERYLLFGQKFIGAEPGFRVWRDLTTLHTELRRRKESGEPVGSPLARGILTVSPRHVVRQLSAFRPLGRAGLPKILLMNTRLLTSFTCELADAYGRRLLSRFQTSKAGPGTEQS